MASSAFSIAFSVSGGSTLLLASGNLGAYAEVPYSDIQSAATSTTPLQSLPSSSWTVFAVSFGLSQRSQQSSAASPTGSLWYLSTRRLHSLSMVCSFSVHAFSFHSGGKRHDTSGPTGVRCQRIHQELDCVPSVSDPISFFILSASCSVACVFGKCSSASVCTCNPGYSGASCDAGFGVIIAASDCPVTCSSQCAVACTGPNICSQCNAGYSGANCETGGLCC